MVTVQDVEKERNRLLRERALKGVLALVDQQTAQGNPYPAIKLAAIISDGQDIMLHLQEIAQLVAPQQPEEGAAPGLPGATGTEAFQQASGIARGGVTQANVPGVGQAPQPPQVEMGQRALGNQTLPPLAQVLVRG